MNFLNWLQPTIAHFHSIGYLLALLFALAETVLGIGLFIPGSTAVLLMGAMAARGTFDIGDLLFFAALGAMLGDNINYYIGRKFGSKIVSKGLRLVKPHHLEKAQRFFNAHGSKSIFLSRFIPSLKEAVPLVAGILKMKRLSFTIWNILGAIGWSLAWILPGYFFVQSLNIAQLWLSRIGWFLLILFLFLIIFYIAKYFVVKKGQALLNILSSLWQSIKQAVSENAEVKRYVGKHPTFFRFLQARFDTTRFFGRPFTLLSIAFIYILALLGGIIEDFVRSDIITLVDIRVAHLMLLFRDFELITLNYETPNELQNGVE